MSIHFKDEEEIVEKLGFSKIDHHKTEHARLLEKGMKLSEAFEVSALGIGDLVHY